MIVMSDTSQGPGWWLASDGRWYPPQPTGPPPGPQHFAQPSPVYVQQARKGGVGRGCLTAIGAAVVAVVVLVVIIIVIAAAGSKSTSTPKFGGGTSAHPATADVTVTCGSTLDAIGLPHASVVIVNHSSGTSDYDVQISFNNAAGNRVGGVGYALESNVAPGQSATTDAVGDAVTAGQGPVVNCPVVSVQRTASN